MQATDLLVEVRDRTLARVGQIKPEHLDLSATIVLNGPGSWKLRLPSEHPMVPALATPGSGIIVHGPDGVLLSGPTSTPTVSADLTDPRGMVTVEGVTDDALLWRRLAYPTPTSADVAAQAHDYDVRTGTAEAVMRAYVWANVGAGAPSPRRVNTLAMTTPTNLGPYVTKSARFDVLGELLAEIAAVAGLRFRVAQVDSLLVFDVLPIEDRRATIRFDLRNGTLTSHEHAQSTPGLTRAIVAGQGQGADRTFLERTTADATSAEASWGPFGRVERFIDQRNTDDLDELAQAGDKALAEEGFSAVAVKAVASDDLTMRFAVDWSVGDEVTVVVNGKETTSTVTSATFIVSKDAVRVGAEIGDVSGFTASDALGRQVEDTERRVSALERTVDTSSAPVAPGMVSMTAASVAPDGWLLCDGRAVSRTTYPRLFSAIGTTYGAGNGSSTFNVPDLRTRVPVGRSAGDDDFGTLGQKGGEKEHTLTVAEMPSHTHTQNAHNHTQNSHVHGPGANSNGFAVHATGGSGWNAVLPIAATGEAMFYRNTASATATNVAATATNQNTGGGGAHNNLQPYVTLNYIIAY